ncbi:hypothetical protein HN587_06980 [Candidatus Woesearchaeota archaeon]|jgi:hypothetical protein|nr:hypothetical protein [Candidatus Woesearchaeota archaeon]
MIGLATYYFVALIVFLGIYCGVALGKIAKEELDPGKKYIEMFQAALLSAIVCSTSYFFGLHWMFGLLVFFPLAFGADYLVRNPLVIQLTYVLLGFLLFASTSSTKFFLVISSLIFLFGLPTGSLYVQRHPTQSTNVIVSDMAVSYSVFFVVAILTSFLSIMLNNL